MVMLSVVCKIAINRP